MDHSPLHHQRLIILILVTCLLSGCRYWSVYQFSEQFCEFDQHISVNVQRGDLNITFHDPVLPRNVLLRYLNARGYAQEEQRYRLRETFYMQRTEHDDHPSQNAPFRIVTDYSSPSETPMLQRGSLGPQLSQLFTPALVEPILKSICSDDYDLGFSRIEMRSELTDIDYDSLPTMQQFITIFGPSKASRNQQLQYHLDFLAPHNAPNSKTLSTEFQNRPIRFILNFDSHNRLKRMDIHYYKYDYWLDFETLTSALVVIRG